MSIRRLTVLVGTVAIVAAACTTGGGGSPSAGNIGCSSAARKRGASRALPDLPSSSNGAHRPV